MPAFLTKQEKTVNTDEIQNDNEKVESQVQKTEENSNYEYKNYGSIKLLHKKTEEVEEVDLDSYLCHVVSAEMPADFDYFKMETLV